MASDYSWTCPYCRQVATITPDNVSSDVHVFDKNNKSGNLGLSTNVIVCPNSKCREFTITAALHKAEYNPRLSLVGKQLLGWNLIPRSSAKPFPDYIPLGTL